MKVKKGRKTGTYLDLEGSRLGAPFRVVPFPGDPCLEDPYLEVVGKGAHLEDPSWEGTEDDQLLCVASVSFVAWFCEVVVDSPNGGGPPGPPKPGGPPNGLGGARC